MLVHFIAPVEGLEENIANLRLIVKCLRDEGHDLARDWLELAYERKVRGDSSNEQAWEKIIQDNMEAIAKAEILIADITYDSTAIGYQIANALHQKKPVLLTLREGQKVSPFTWNLPSSFLKRVEYTPKNIGEKVIPFLKENDISTKDMRFNFFIDRQIYNYLRWSAFKTGKTKAEILRTLVQREIENKD
jgi:hypothetical protein